MHRVAVGQQHTAGEVLAGAPQRVAVVPLQRLRVEDQFELEPVALLQLRDALGDALRGEPGHDHRALEADGGEVAERDVEDRAVAVDRQQGLGQALRLAAETRSRACGEHHADHWPSSSSSSYMTGRCARLKVVHACTDSATSTTPSAAATT